MNAKSLNAQIINAKLLKSRFMNAYFINAKFMNVRFVPTININPKQVGIGGFWLVQTTPDSCLPNV